MDGRRMKHQRTVPNGVNGTDTTMKIETGITPQRHGGARMACSKGRQQTLHYQPAPTTLLREMLQADSRVRSGGR